MYTSHQNSASSTNFSYTGGEITNSTYSCSTTTWKSQNNIEIKGITASSRGGWEPDAGETGSQIKSTSTSTAQHTAVTVSTYVFSVYSTTFLEGSQTLTYTSNVISTRPDPISWTMSEAYTVDPYTFTYQGASYNPEAYLPTNIPQGGFWTYLSPEQIIAANSITETTACLESTFSTFPAYPYWFYYTTITTLMIITVTGVADGGNQNSYYGNAYTTQQSVDVSTYYPITSADTTVNLTIPSFHEGQCTSTTTTQATVSETTTGPLQEYNIPALGLQRRNRGPLGSQNHYYATGNSAMYVLSRQPVFTTNSFLYKFSDVFSLNSVSYFSSAINEGEYIPSPLVPGYMFSLSEATFLYIRSPINNTGWAGFGNGFDAEDPTIYKTLTTSSSGDTWGESNLLQTSDIGNPIEDAGPHIIQTGCQPWAQDGTTAWSVPANTVESSTESTLLATYSSTVSTSTAEGQPTTSTRSDKYATYTIGLESINSDKTTINTNVVNFFYEGDIAPITQAQLGNLTPNPYISFMIGRDNYYTSKQSLLFRTGYYISSTRVDSTGGETTAEQALTETNTTYTREVDLVGFGYSTYTYSAFQIVIDQNEGVSFEVEPLYEYASSGLGVRPINTILDS